jgi:hypothetical protein
MRLQLRRILVHISKFLTKTTPDAGETQSDMHTKVLYFAGLGNAK